MDWVLRPEQQREPVGAAGAGAWDGGGAGGVACESVGGGWWWRERGRGPGWGGDGLKGLLLLGMRSVMVGGCVGWLSGRIMGGRGMAFPTHGNHHVTDHGETTIHGLGIIIAATSPDRTSGQGGQNQHSVHTSTAEVGARNTVITVTVTTARGGGTIRVLFALQTYKREETRQPAYQQRYDGAQPTQ